MLTKLPGLIKCPECHKGLELNEEDRSVGKFECPWCNAAIDKSNEIFEIKNYTKITDANKHGVHIAIQLLLFVIAFYIIAGFIWSELEILALLIPLLYLVTACIIYIIRILRASNVELGVYWFGISLSYGILNGIEKSDKTDVDFIDVFLLSAVLFFIMGIISLYLRQDIMVYIIKYLKKRSIKSAK